jgi:ATP-dependent Clp protease ATP-binding subunit ClpX
LTKQFQALFGLEKTALEFEPEALYAIAKQAIERKTGARGLRSIIEQILLDTMYELPSLTDRKHVRVDQGAVEGKHAPKWAVVDAVSEAVG